MALQNLGAHGLFELQRKVAAGLPLNLTPREILQLAETGQKLEMDSLGEERDVCLTKICVIVGDRAPDEPEPTPPEPPKIN
jgi:hypothetical protein